MYEVARTVHTDFPGTVKADEIVQIALVENEEQVMSSDDNLNKGTIAPLTDAPMISAPFRFISFIASTEKQMQRQQYKFDQSW
ncbi:hypothetical protein Leryth_003536 [Lithospermum erythrorhizon]|nr:hypothetical protein Leryth_003536 [Lithospermum erythrorhizon]